MSFSSDDTKQRVKEAIDIVDLVGRYIQLRRQGRNFVGLCPWHDDSRPSLQVNPERQSFKCWVCDIGGDVFSFVMKMEGVEFREALALLADQAGIELQARAPSSPAAASAGTTSAASGGVQTKRRLYQAMAWAEKKYHECLLTSPEADAARRYLRDRGITDESIERFHLGYSPNRGNWLLRLAEEARANTALLETVGILARSASGELYDRFHGRLLFSIRDPQDRPIALGGRVLPESGSTSPAKYINSPETPLFRKSKTLYGLDLARHAMRKSREVVVMEGYTDVIAAHQCGFQQAVAVLGTALGEEHIRTLSPFADRIVLVLDGDEAGQRRANEVLGLFVAQQVDLRIVTLPEGLDPAEFLAEHGAEAFKDLVETRAVDALEHAFQARTHRIDLEHEVHLASEALEELVAIVAKAPRLREGTTPETQLREQKILEQLAFRFRVPEKDVRDRLTALRRKGGPRKVQMRGSSEMGESSVEGSAAFNLRLSILDWQRHLLEIIVGHAECLELARKGIPCESLTNELCRAIYQTCCRLADEGVAPTFDRLMLEFEDAAVKSLLVELDESPSAKEITDPAAFLEELIQNYRAHQARERFPAQRGALREGVKDEAHFLEQIVQQEKSRHGISDPTEG